MNAKVFVCSIYFLVGFPFLAAAQDRALDPLEAKASGEAYAKAIQFRGIDADVVYYDPAGAAPEFEIRATPQSPLEGRDEGQRSISFETVRSINVVIAALVILGVTYLFVVYGGRLSVAFSRSPQDGRPDRMIAQSDSDEAAEQGSATLHTILSMTDRREALLALCRSLLSRTVAAQGILFQRSWTDREALRRIPGNCVHKDALHALVFASEKVHFGGRDVTEDEFRMHLARLEPLWKANPS